MFIIYGRNAPKSNNNSLQLSHISPKSNNLLQYGDINQQDKILQDEIQDDERIVTVVLYDNCNPRSFKIDITLIQSLPLEEVFKSITPKEYFALDNRSRFLKQHIKQGNIVVYSIVVEPNNVYKFKIKLPTAAKLLKGFILADLQSGRSIKKAVFGAKTDIIIYCDQEGLYVEDNLADNRNE